ncbi:MAG: hypothetical protein ACI91B_003751 [Planctomycetota bacterium]
MQAQVAQSHGVGRQVADYSSPASIGCVNVTKINASMSCCKRLCSGRRVIGKASASTGLREALSPRHLGALKPHRACWGRPAFGWQRHFARDWFATNGASVVHFDDQPAAEVTLAVLLDDAAR